MADWKTTTYTLAYPITVGEGVPLFAAGTQVTEVTLREPDTEALEFIEENEKPGSQIRNLRFQIQGLSGLPAEILKKLHHKDITKLGELMLPLLQDGAAGEPSDKSEPK